VKSFEAQHRSDPLLYTPVVLFDSIIEILARTDPDSLRHSSFCSEFSHDHAFVAKERQRLTVPARKDEVSKLADHYSSSPLGDLRVERQGAHTTGSVPNLCCRRNGCFGVSEGMK
jgi:hypothetical protein